MRRFTRMEDTACAPEYVCEHRPYNHGGGLTAFLEINDHAPVYTCHCTGPHAYDVLRETLGECIAFLPAGSMIEV